MEFRDRGLVRYLNHMGDDREIVEDARTSVRPPSNRPSRKSDRSLSARDLELIADFFQHGHASTMRGCILKLEFEVPIWLQREIKTHWVGMSQLWNENDWLGDNNQSGRYRPYLPIFWLPGERAIAEGADFNPMKARFEEDPVALNAARELIKLACRQSWDTYEQLLEQKIAREVARTVLPEGTFVSGRITANLNAWLGFCAMRIDHPDNRFPTSPQWEIQQLAEQIEAIIQTHWPHAHDAWIRAGRRRP